MIEYHPTYAARVRDLSHLGATDAEIAHIVGVSLSTLKNWRERYPEFAAAWDDGRIQADMKVAGALFKRACGYEITKWKETDDGMLRELVHYPPDVKACTFWLTNRRPEQWQNKIEHDVGNNGKLIIDQLSELEAARRIAYALTKATQGGDDNDQASKPASE